MRVGDLPGELLVRMLGGLPTDLELGRENALSSEGALAGTQEGDQRGRTTRQHRRQQEKTVSDHPACETCTQSSVLTMVNVEGCLCRLEARLFEIGRAPERELM